MARFSKTGKTYYGTEVSAAEAIWDQADRQAYGNVDKIAKGADPRLLPKQHWRGRDKN